MIMLSPPGTEDAALAALREGAYDYVHQPFKADEVIMAVRKAEERERLRREVEALRSNVGIGAVKELVVSQSPAMRDVLELASRVARHNTPVLITGESGTGKEVIARAIHRMSPRSERSFTAVNCGAIPEQLLESELFGHTKGAFPGATTDHAGLFELADGGTLFLDEIADVSPGLQAKILRVLEEGQVRRLGGRDSRKIDVRVLAATGRPVEQAVERGEFRSDLYYRLNVVRLHIPPLRERPEDIPELLTHFARQMAQRLGHPVSITPAALAALTHHSWPGNVRELRNTLERAAVLGVGGPLDSKDFALIERRRVRPERGGQWLARSPVAGGSGGAGGHPARPRRPPRATAGRPPICSASACAPSSTSCGGSRLTKSLRAGLGCAQRLYGCSR